MLFPFPQANDRDAARWILLARQTVEACAFQKAPPNPQQELPSKGVFVTVERDGTILGCRGTLKPRERTLDGEIIAAATGASKFDPRYGPIKKDKLGKFLVTVTIVEQLDSCTSVDGLKPSEGLVLKAGSKTGVVLPWEGKNPKTRLAWAYRKAGVAPGTTVILMKMVAERYRG
jgi:AMMECR1 domain-containing protein